jgi:hypothetical protein
MDKEEVLRRVGFGPKEAVKEVPRVGSSSRSGKGVGTIVSRTRIELRPNEVMVR